MSGAFPASSTSQDPPGFVDPRVLMQIRSLELRARHIVEGFWSGLNRSPYHGFSVEFTEYRQYTPGDDPRYLDWKLVARSDRYSIKRFEDETNLRCQIVLDASRSMEFGSIGYTKFDYARTLAASLGYFLVQQRDAVGLARFSDRIEDYLPPRYRTGHWRRFLTLLDAPCSGRATDLATPLEEVAAQTRHRGMVVLISDLLAPIDKIELSLSTAIARGQEGVLFQILDPRELDFEFAEPELFEDLESGRQIYVDPATMGRSYREKLQQHLSSIDAVCARLGVTLERLSTADSPGDALAAFLRARLHRGAGRGLVRPGGRR